MWFFFQTLTFASTSAFVDVSAVSSCTGLHVFWCVCLLFCLAEHCFDMCIYMVLALSVWLCWLGVKHQFTYLTVWLYFYVFIQSSVCLTVFWCLCSVLFVWLYFALCSALFVWLYFDVFVQCSVCLTVFWCVCTVLKLLSDHRVPPGILQVWLFWQGEYNCKHVSFGKVSTASKFDSFDKASTSSSMAFGKVSTSSSMAFLGGCTSSSLVCLARWVCLQVWGHLDSLSLALLVRWVHLQAGLFWQVSISLSLTLGKVNTSSSLALLVRWIHLQTLLFWWVHLQIGLFLYGEDIFKFGTFGKMSTSMALVPSDCK